MKEKLKIHEFYEQLREMLNDEQRKILFQLYCEHEDCEMKADEEGFKSGERHGFKTAIKLIVDAI